MKKLFNIKSTLSTAGAYAIGGVGNAAMDYAVENFDALKGLSPFVLGLVKIGVGVAGRSLTKQSIINQAADGVGIAGASDIIKGILDESISFGGNGEEQKTPDGLPAGTIGRLRAGNRRFMTRHKVSGVDSYMGV